MRLRFKGLSVFLLSLSLSLVLFTTGCSGGHAVYNVKEAPVTMRSENYTLSDVEKAIVKAGRSLGWQMQKAKPGHIIGTLYIRRHMAKVDITYNRLSYNIEYKDSDNLKYDGTSIHRKYNQWIRNLSQRIRSNLDGTGGFKLNF
jgi:hypothetical protein